MLSVALGVLTMVMVTARQVAEHLGISVSTVGRALSQDPRISVETRMRVKAASEALGYVENGPARMMRGGSSKLVGLILPDIKNTFYSTIAQSLSQCFDEEGFHIALSVANDDRDVEARHVKDFVSARVAGIVIVPTAAPRRETIGTLANIPYVQLLRRVGTLQSDWFGIDDVECIRTGAKHLLDLGHRRIAYVGGAVELPTGADRVAGFRKALADANAKPGQAIEMLGGTTDEFGYEAIDKLLSMRSPPTAIICGAVRVTSGIVEALAERQVAVPDTVSVVGFGDPPWSKWWGKGLTTLRMPIQEIATSCGLWFLHGLKAKQPQLHPHRSITPASLVIRGSSAPPSR